ncbi:hypothetical protein FHS40_003674 [Streptomyces spectabilis]|uniref:Uncharacterized protein n=1 Tax=Streptomyces spectabilis TaxID=68270 RepID=A0A7W8EVD5_STRST|nr:hypothetical protein [Streptomyces spectabilis]
MKRDVRFPAKKYVLTFRIHDISCLVKDAIWRVASEPPKEVSHHAEVVRR